METFTSSCSLCPWSGPVRVNEDWAHGDAVWHVYESHSSEWVKAVGARPPQDADPRAVN